MSPHPTARREPGAASLVSEGLSRLADGLGVVLLAALAWRMFYGFGEAFQQYAMAVGLIGALACLTSRGAIKSFPAAIAVFLAIGLLSAGVHRWTSASANASWWSLFTPALHLVVMAVFVFGAAHLLRTPSRLSWFVVLMVAAIAVLAVQIAFDRVAAGFVYERGGPSLPSVPQWGGIHGTSLLLTIALPMASAGLVARRSIWQAAAALTLAGGLLITAYFNGSRGGLVAMALVLAGMTVFAALGATRRGRQPALLAGGVTAVALGMVAATWMLRGRLERGEDLSGRTLMWEAALRIMAENPWLGVGPGNFYEAIVSGGYLATFEGKFIGFSNAHNLWLHVGAELGLPGAICLTLVLAWALRACWRGWVDGRLPMVSVGLLFALLGFMTHSLSENFLEARVQVERTRLVVWMLLAAVLALERLTRRATPQARPSNAL